MIVYDIEYDENVTSLHGTLLKGLRERLDLCKQRRADFDMRVDDNERRTAIYKKKNKNDHAKVVKKKKGESDYSEIIIPQSYALMVSAHTYLCNVFLQRDPVWSVQGIQDEGQLKELAVETYLRYQHTSGGHARAEMIWLLDPCRYGVGIIGNYWENETKVVTALEEVPKEVDGVIVEGEFEKQFRRREVPGYEGSRLYNVYPKDFIFDPRVPMGRLQDMEFCGRNTTISMSEALARSAKGTWFNVDEAISRVSKNSDSRDFNDDVDRTLDELTGAASTDKSNKILSAPSKGKSSGLLDIEELSITIIPSHWGIADSDYPEKWHFTIAQKSVIVCAYPFGTLHQEHPMHVLEMELDGYRQDSRSLMEVTEPLNDVLNWQFNSHMFNRRAAMNNQFVYDPMRVEERDLRSREAGKLIRLKATAYGTDVRSAIHQLPVSDVTASNVHDAQQVISMMQKQTGINEDVSGGSSTSSRRSATEFNATTGFSMGRLSRDAYWMAITGWRSLGLHLISDSQQFYTSVKKMKIAGYTGISEELVEVSPETIAGRFDVVAVDGTLPVSKLQQANFWKEALMGLSSVPEIAANYRLEDMFAHMSRLGGLAAISKFRIEPDEKVKRLLEKGLIEDVTKPTTGGVGGGTSTGTQPPPSTDQAFRTLGIPEN